MFIVQMRMQVCHFVEVRFLTYLTLNLNEGLDEQLEILAFDETLQVVVILEVQKGGLLVSSEALLVIFILSSGVFSEDNHWHFESAFRTGSLLEEDAQFESADDAKRPVIAWSDTESLDFF